MLPATSFNPRPIKRLTELMVFAASEDASEAAS